jgi:hypothetical protein
MIVGPSRVEKGEDVSLCLVDLVCGEVVLVGLFRSAHLET